MVNKPYKGLPTNKTKLIKVNSSDILSYQYQYKYKCFNIGTMAEGIRRVEINGYKMRLRELFKGLFATLKVLKI